MIADLKEGENPEQEMVHLWEKVAMIHAAVSTYYKLQDQSEYLKRGMKERSDSVQYAANNLARYEADLIKLADKQVDSTDLAAYTGHQHQLFCKRESVEEQRERVKEAQDELTEVTQKYHECLEKKEQLKQLVSAGNFGAFSEAAYEIPYLPQRRRNYY